MLLLQEIFYDRLCTFPNKRPRDTELFIDYKRSLFYVFVLKPIHRNHTNTCNYIMKGTYAMQYVTDFCITMKCRYITN